MDVPRNCLYSRDHFWVRPEGDEAVVGLTDHLQRELGPVVLVDLPERGQDVEAMVSFGVVESEGTVSELLSPVTGEVAAANVALAEEPDMVNEDPYGEGWLVRVLLTEPDQISALMTPEEYEEYTHRSQEERDEEEA